MVSPSATDPLIDSDPLTAPQTKEVIEDDIELNDLPSFSVKEDSSDWEWAWRDQQLVEPEVPNFDLTDEQKENHAGFKEQYGSFEETSDTVTEPPVPNKALTPSEPLVAQVDAAKEVVASQHRAYRRSKARWRARPRSYSVLNVHCAGEIPFVGTENLP